MRHQQEEALALMREVLQDDLLEFQAETFSLKESFVDHRCEVYLTIKDARSGEQIPLEGLGVGLVDAVFQGIKGRFSPEYASLNSIAFSAFDLKGIMSSGHLAQTDAKAHVFLGVRNSYGHEFTFESQSRSIARACVEVTLMAMTYFINSERAFITMYKARKHYETTGRTDLVQKYTDLLSRMVANTSYSEIIDRLKAEL